MAFVAFFTVAPATAETLGDGDAISTAARVTATKLRHRWDSVRTRDPRAAACIEPKMAEAMVLVSRVDRRRVELRDSIVAAEREASRRALLVLDARRADLEAESNACSPVFQPIVGGTLVTMKVLQSIAAHEPSMGVVVEPELLRALIGPMTAR